MQCMYNVYTMYFYTALPFHIFKDTEVNELDRCRMSRLRIFPGVHHAAQVYNTVCGMRVDDIWIHMSWKRMQRDLSSQILSFPVSAGRERRFLIFLVDKPARLIIRKSWKDNGCILLPQSKKTLLPKTFVAVKFGESSRQTATASI